MKLKMNLFDLSINSALVALVLVVIPKFALAADVAPVRIIVHSDSPQFTAESLAEVLNSEYHLETTTEALATARGTLTVAWAEPRSELVITYEAHGGPVVSRIVAVEKSVQDNIRAASALGFALIQMAPTVPETPSAVAVLKKEPEPQSYPAVVASASLFYPLASNMHKPEASTHFDFNLLHSRIGALDGFQLGTVNVVSRTVVGMQLAPFGANHVQGQVRGVQGALFYNAAGAGFDGVQIAGFNYSGGTSNGLQASFAGNVARGGFVGGQIGAVNVSTGATSGVQLGALNVHTDETVVGAQIGFLNIGKRVTGVQLGLINVASEIEGLPIGLISVSESGGIHPVAFWSSSALVNAGVKFATRYTYTALLAVYDPVPGDRNFLGVKSGERWGAGYLVGGTIPFFNWFAANADLGVTYLYGGGAALRAVETTNAGDLIQAKLRLSLSLKIAKHFSIFAGAGANLEARFETFERVSALVLRPDFFAGIEL